MKNKVIRATSDAFLEDPLRAYRVARFLAQLSNKLCVDSFFKTEEYFDNDENDFKIDDYTLELMKKCKLELDFLSSERVFAELERALQANRPSKFFNALKSANLLEEHFKEVNDLIGVEQPIQYHPEGDAYEHTMLVIDKIAIDTSNPSIVFAGLVHDLGKAATPKEILPRHINHEENGIEPLNKLCSRLKLPAKWHKIGKTACLEHMRAGIFDIMTYPKRVDFIERIYKSSLGLDGMEILANADKTTNRKIEFAIIGKEMMTEINGKKYPGEKEFNKLKEKVRADRIKWLKEHMPM